MAGVPHFVWIPLLLLCAFQATDNRFVQPNVQTITSHGGSSDLGGILSHIPIDLPEGINPENINITKITIQTCPGLKEQLTLVNQQHREAILHNIQLDDTVFGLKRKVNSLEAQLATCSSTAPIASGCYHTELHNRLKQLLGTFDSDAFLILKVIQLTTEVNTLRDKIKHATDESKETTAEATLLQVQLQKKINELNAKTQQIERNNTNSRLILDIITLQNQIWTLQQEEWRRGETSLQPDQQILALQEQLEKKISQLRGTGYAFTDMLELISVHSKIAMRERFISNYIEKSRTNAADYQRQWRQKAELLTQKIVQLNANENDQKLTQEILELQVELQQLRLLLANTRETSDSNLKELRVIWDSEKKQQQHLLKQLEETEYAQAQLIIKIINTMKELRETQIEETTSTSSETLRAQLQAKERAYAESQAEIRELQRKVEECSGLEERYDQVKTEFELKIAELNRTGDSKAALILNVINLNEEIKTLKARIDTTEDQKSIYELQRQLQEKQRELDSTTANIERLIANPRIILTILQLQNEIWDLQKTAPNATTSDRIKGLQAKVDDLITKIDNPGENTKLLLTILTLQNQVGQLQRQLSDVDTLRFNEVTQLKNDLTTKRKELQEHIDELKEYNQTNARLILKITDLHGQLRNIEEKQRNQNTSSSLTITELREELRQRRLEHTSDQAEIQTLKGRLETKQREHDSAQAEVEELQRKLQAQIQQCALFEEQYAQAKTELEKHIANLKTRGDSKEALILSLLNLHNELSSLTALIATTKDPDKKSELQGQLEQKQDELHLKKTDLEELVSNPELFLTIIELQTEILNLQQTDTNGTTRIQIEGLQKRLNDLVNTIDNKEDENIKLMLRIITLQSQVEGLQRLFSNLKLIKTTEVAQLRNDLTTSKNQLQKYTNDLKEKNQTNAELILKISDLTNQLRNLQVEWQNKGQTTSATIFDLREQLKIRTEECLQDQATIQDLQDKLNQTDAVCSSYEQRLKELQSELDGKMNELLAKSSTVTSLALQMSTLNLQLEEAKRQLENAESPSKIKELKKLIDEKTDELAKKTEELKSRSPQAQRLLHIITIQTEIEKLVNVAVNDSDYAKIRAYEDRLKHLIDGIEDDKNENTKLMFQVLAQKEEIARLKKQEKAQKKAYLEKLAELENELAYIRNQIGEKTRLLEGRSVTISNLSAQIIEHHQKLKPLEDEILELKDTNAENVAELQRRLDLSKKQLQDSERQLSEADAKNFDLIMEITDLRSQLKKAGKRTSKVAEKKINELEDQVQTQQRQIKKLETTNTNLQQQVKDLKMICNENSDCKDVEMQLTQSQEQAVRLQQQLLDKDAKLKQLQRAIDEQTRRNNRQQQEYDSLVKQFQQTQAELAIQKEQQAEKDALLSRLEQNLNSKTTDYNKLLDDYNELQNEKNKLEESNRELEKRVTDIEENTIYTRKTTFDPSTAHPRIVLSADKTEMSTTMSMQNVPDNPRRFNVELGVLGSTGFSSGRQYWEVSVADKLCYHIGMASESAPKKGIVSYSPANGYWTIILNKQGQFKAIDKRSVFLQVETQPIRLGILLNYKIGQISFYDAGARTHLYTFAGQRFTDKIYPFVNFCVEDVESPSPIVLLTPGSVDWIK